MWMLWGSRILSQWGVVHRSHVLLVCRKFWFLYTVIMLGRQCKREQVQIVHNLWPSKVGANSMAALLCY
jgi:hypothetical protein